MILMTAISVMARVSIDVTLTVVMVWSQWLCVHWPCHICSTR